MNDLILSNFSSYFSIFAVLNLGYATSQSFRTAVDDGILKITAFEKWNKNEVAQIRARLNATSESTVDKTFQKKVNEFKNKFDLEVKELKDNRENAAEFVNGLKSTFLCTAFYSFTFLIVAGYQTIPSVPKQPNSNFIIYDILHVLNLSLLLFNSIVFFRSLTKYYAQPIKPFIVTITFLAIIILTIIFCVLLSCKAVIFAVSMSLNWCTGLGIFLALSPYLFHFYRAFLHTNKFRPIEREFITKTEADLNNLKVVKDFLEEDLADQLNKPI